MHHRRQIADFLGKFFAQPADPPEQFALLVIIHQRNQPVTDFHRQQIFRHHIIPGRFRDFIRLTELLLLHIVIRLFDRLFAFLHQIPAERCQRHREQQKHKVRHARDKPQQTQNPGTQPHYTRVVEQLGDHLLTGIFICCHAGHNHTGCG